MLHLFSNAINPAIPLGHALSNWSCIAQGLAERPRRRSRQMEVLCSLISLS